MFHNCQLVFIFNASLQIMNDAGETVILHKATVISWSWSKV